MLCCFILKHISFLLTEGFLHRKYFMIISLVLGFSFFLQFFRLKSINLQVCCMFRRNQLSFWAIFKAFFISFNKTHRNNVPYNNIFFHGFPQNLLHHFPCKNCFLWTEKPFTKRLILKKKHHFFRDLTPILYFC